MSGNIFATSGQITGSTNFYWEECPKPRAALAPFEIAWLYDVAIYAAQPFVINFQQLITQGAIKGVQGVFIDNTSCNAPVAVIDEAGLSMVCPAGAQAVFPVKYVQNGSITFQAKNPDRNQADYGTTTFSLLNFPVDSPYVWQPLTNIASTSFGVGSDSNQFAIVDGFVYDTFYGQAVPGAGHFALTGRVVNAATAPNGWVVEAVENAVLYVPGTTTPAYPTFAGRFGLQAQNAASPFADPSSYVQGYNWSPTTSLINLPGGKCGIYVGNEYGQLTQPTLYGQITLDVEIGTGSLPTIKAIVNAKCRIL